jgi:hypothetical protein
MLEGCPFTIYTNHKPLILLWAMQLRQLSSMAEFMADIGHIPGTENIIADALYQLPLAAFTLAATGRPAVEEVAASPIILDYARVVANQCQETLKEASSTSLQLHHMDMQGQAMPIILCQISKMSSGPSRSGPAVAYVHLAAYDSLIGLARHVL